MWKNNPVWNSLVCVKDAKGANASKCNALILAQIRSISCHDNAKMSSIFRSLYHTDTDSYSNLLAELNRFGN